MNQNPDNGRRKVLIVSMLIFLFLGGGAFMFMTFQGLGDLKGGAKTSFSYGFSVREAVLPVFEYFGLAENEADRTELSKKRLAARGLDVSLLSQPRADISDWMAKGAVVEGGRRSSYASAPVRTNIPKMSGGLGGSGGEGGGESMSSADIAGFGGGRDSGNAKILRNGSGGPAPAMGKSKTLNALSNARASLGEGLRSDSAMTARSKWDQGFGSGVTGKNSGELAYGKSGLVKLDHIKSGDITDLKTINTGSLKVAEPGAPARATESGDAADKSASTAGGKDAIKSVIDAVGKSISGGTADSGSKAAPRDSGAPPKEVTDLLKASDMLCPKPNGCECSVGGAYSSAMTLLDDDPVYSKNEDGSWKATVNGNAKFADGYTMPYASVYAVTNGVLTLVSGP